MNSFKFYYVTTAKSNSKKLECYGSHATIEGALIDQLHRAYDYNQKTSVYGVQGNNELVKIA